MQQETQQILFVDRDTELYLQLGDCLADQSLAITHIEKSTEALRFLQGEHVGLVVLNVGSCSMPVSEIVPIIRGIDKDLPIIVTCDRNTPDLERQIRAQNIFYYHIKSFGISDLELAVKNALAKRRVKRVRIKEGE
jgi:DNA-binding NtrC family response regulator